MRYFVKELIFASHFPFYETIEMRKNTCHYILFLFVSSISFVQTVKFYTVKTRSNIHRSIYDINIVYIYIYIYTFSKIFKIDLKNKRNRKKQKEIIEISFFFRFRYPYNRLSTNQDVDKGFKIYLWRLMKQECKGCTFSFGKLLLPFINKIIGWKAENL